MAQQRSRNTFKTIDEVISTEKSFSSLRETVKNYDVVDSFTKIFPDLTEIATAVKSENKILFLRVENSVWRSELNFRKNLIVEKINRYFNEQIIKTIKFL
jgi:hypothetical protein